MNTHSIQAGPAGHHGRLAWGLAIGAVAAALVLMVMRGPVRGMEGSYDLRLVYAGVRAWVEGMDPYAFENTQRAALEGGVPGAAEWEAQKKLVLYPPPTFTAMAPLGMLDWRTASPVWLGLNLLMLGVLGAALVNGTGLRDRPLAATWFAAGLIAMAPVHTTLATGQTALISTALGVAGLVMIWRNRWLKGGLLLGLAVAIKPQLMGPALIALLFCGQWRGLAASLTVTGVLGIAGIARLQATGEPWWAHFQENLAIFKGPGGMGDPSSSGPLRFQLLNLHYPLYELMTKTVVVNLIVWALALLVVVMLVRYLKFAVTQLGLEQEGPSVSPVPVGRPTVPWRLVACLMVLGLLVVYHRPYDAVVLAVPLAWGAAVVSGSGQWSAIVVLICWAAFLTPGGAFLAELERQGWISEAVRSSTLWQAVILPHQVWALVLMAVALAVGGWRALER